VVTIERPGFTPGYGISDEGTGLLDWAWAEERLVASRTYWVCTTRADGRPHAAPVWGLWLDGALLFSSDPSSVKGRNLARRPDVVVHLESGDEAVICEGRIEPMRGDDLLIAFADAYEAKYAHRPDTSNPAHGMYVLRPTTVLAWREADFPTSATRFRFD
jgi:Pyridoxamine 5'-phosphate oxidase